MDLLREMLRVVQMPDMLVRGLPPPTSPWALLPDGPQGSQTVALALDDHIRQELLDAFRAPEPRTRLVNQTSSFCIPQLLYPKFFKAPSLDEQVLATSNARGTLPASTVVVHCKVIETLYEAFMATFRMNWHASVLVHYSFSTPRRTGYPGIWLFTYIELWWNNAACAFRVLLLLLD